MVRSCLLVFVACIIGMAIENKHCYARNKPTESRTPKYEIVEGNDGQSLRFVLAEETFRKGIMCYIQPKFGNQIIIIFSDDESQQTYNEICELLSKNSVSAAMVMENATIEVVEGNVLRHMKRILFVPKAAINNSGDGLRLDRPQGWIKPQFIPSVDEKNYSLWMVLAHSLRQSALPCYTNNMPCAVAFWYKKNEEPRITYISRETLASLENLASEFGEVKLPVKRDIWILLALVVAGPTSMIIAMLMLLWRRRAKCTLRGAYLDTSMAPDKERIDLGTRDTGYLQENE